MFDIPRNCIVGKHYRLKISDHAMYCTRYECDYYTSDTKTKLPIRWMAWESLLLVSRLRRGCWNLILMNVISDKKNNCT